MAAMQIAMVFVVMGMSLLRYPPGIPLVRGCSLAISAACHPPSEAIDMAVERLKYGVLVSEGIGADERVGLSSRKVAPLHSGYTYGSGMPHCQLDTVAASGC